MFAHVWLAKASGMRKHYFPADQIEQDGQDDVETACGVTVARGDIAESEYSDTAVYCHSCLLHAGSAVRLHQPAAA